MNVMNTPEVGIPLKGCLVQESLGEEGALSSSHKMAFNAQGMGSLLHAWKNLDYSSYEFTEEKSISCT